MVELHVAHEMLYSVLAASVSEAVLVYDSKVRIEPAAWHLAPGTAAGVAVASVSEASLALIVRMGFDLAA
jgi:hypothetical protein